MAVYWKWNFSEAVFWLNYSVSLAHGKGILLVHGSKCVGPPFLEHRFTISSLVSQPQQLEDKVLYLVAGILPLHSPRVTSGLSELLRMTELHTLPFKNNLCVCVCVCVKGINVFRWNWRCLSPLHPDSHPRGKCNLKVLCMFPILILIHFKNKYLFTNKKYYMGLCMLKFISFFFSAADLFLNWLCMFRIYSHCSRYSSF